MTPSPGRSSTSGTSAGALRWTEGLRRPACLVLALVLAGCQHLPPVAKTAQAPPPPYRLGPGDRVEVTVFQRQDLSGEFEVDGSGRLALPLIGGVQAEGLTLPELEKAIGDRLAEEKLVDASISVNLVKTRPVCVLGEVVKAGCFDYFYGMRVASALAMAGGYTYRARKNVVGITRENGDKLSGNHDTLVYPGDIIEVEGRLF